jgi:hypothetical protein
VKFTTTATEFAGLRDLLSDRRVVAIVEEVGTWSLRAISEADASVCCVEARAALRWAPFRQADEARDRTRFSDLFPHGAVLAKVFQVFARRVFHEAITAVNIEACMFWCSILADARFALDERGDIGVDLEGTILLEEGLVAMRSQGNAVLNKLFCLCGRPLGSDYRTMSCGRPLNKGCGQSRRDQSGEAWQRENHCGL